MRLFPPNWPYREFNYNRPLDRRESERESESPGRDEESADNMDDSKYDWIKETYVNSRLNRPYNNCKTCPYQGQLSPYMNLTNLYNPKFNQTIS
jgi:hypothetical protein